MDATEKKAFVEWIEDNGDEGGKLYMTFSDEELEKIFLTAYERGKHEKEQRENDELEQENAELRRKKAAGKTDG